MGDSGWEWAVVSNSFIAEDKATAFCLHPSTSPFRRPAVRFTASSTPPTIRSLPDFTSPPVDARAFVVDCSTAVREAADSLPPSAALYCSCKNCTTSSNDSSLLPSLSICLKMAFTSSELLFKPRPCATTLSSRRTAASSSHSAIPLSRSTSTLPKIFAASRVAFSRESSAGSFFSSASMSARVRSMSPGDMETCDRRVLATAAWVTSSMCWKT
mmetsp:Transcript_72930/g.194639  ORF Transcript_72930/g.194639 Transcript_72930/m.194639 type:complete len:214 (-) Transcript_72930:1198-1839(-)